MKVLITYLADRPSPNCLVINRHQLDACCLISYRKTTSIHVLVSYRLDITWILYLWFVSSSPQITQLKIDNNPFAKGFRDREKVYPQKRSAPFLEQLREAAATTEVKQRRTAASEESQVSSAGNSPIKTELGGSAVVPPSIYSVLSSDSLNMYHNTAKLELLRQQLIRQHDPLPTSSAAQVSNPFFPFNMNKLPMVNLPFSLFQSRPCS